MILDPTTRETVSLIPLYLEEGEESVEIPLIVVPEAADSFLGANLSNEVTLWGKIAPGAFQNLAVSPIDLDPFFGSETEVIFKVQAGANLPGVTRVYVTAGIGKPAAAAWMI